MYNLCLGVQEEGKSQALLDCTTTCCTFGLHAVA